MADLERLMESQERGEPGPLIWTCKSLRQLAKELGTQGHAVSYRTIGNLLHRLGYNFGRHGDYKKYSLADRHTIFYRIVDTAAAFLQNGEPVLFVQHQESPEITPLVISGLQSWWEQTGLQLYPKARRMLLTTEDRGTENTWKVPLEAFATTVGLEIAVILIPPGTWRWQRSVRQANVSYSVLEGSYQAAEMSVRLDLVLPGPGTGLSS